jgi:hypothetical protein
MTFQVRETILVAAMVAAGLGLLFWVSNPQPSAAPSESELALTQTSPPASPVRQPGGDPSFSYAGQEFTVPEPGDPQWEDYQAMLRDPHVRTSVSQAPGFRVPYDPEWRAMLTGRREVEPLSYPLVGYSNSIEELAQEFLDALRDRRPEILAEMRVDEDEWTAVFWPEFPQSRPYLKIPAEEAWDFHDAEARSAANKALREYAGTALTLESLSHGEPRVYTNFSLIGDLRIHAVDEETGERVEISLLSMVAERQGRYKAYIFNEG